MKRQNHEVVIKGKEGEKTIVFTGENKPKSFIDFEVATNVPVKVNDWQYDVIVGSGREIVSDRALDC